MKSVTKSMTSTMSSLFKLLIICIESFFMNVYIAGKCLYLYFNKYPFQDISVENFNKMISSEIEKQKQNNPELSNIGCWIGVIFCFNVFWTIFANLVFPMVQLILFWVFIWSVGFAIKQKTSGLSISDLLFEFKNKANELFFSKLKTA